MTLKARLERLEKMAPDEIPWGYVYDLLVEMEASVPMPGEDGERARELARHELGSRDDFIERQQSEVARWQ
jgi:hypothetical protein